jgi:DNA polymerase-3 subunit delta'
MPNLALHGTTQLSLEHFAAAPAHAVLIAGTAGIGKATVGQQLAEQILELPDGKLVDYAYYRSIVSADGKAIGIEPIRELEHFLSLKVPGTRAIKRIIIIEDSQLLTTEAQNALLKTLEEPPQDTVLILTAPSAKQLLPTIQSRLQTINITRPAKDVLQANFAEQNVPMAQFESIYAISGGLPGLAHALLTNAEHPLVPAVTTARQLISKTAYERLLQVDELAKNKQLAQDTLHILQQMAHISLQTATGSASKRWQGILTSSYEASQQLAASGQPKLVLTNAFLQL